MVTVLDRSTPVARKTHRCECCNTTIQPGEKYHRQSVVYDSRAYTWKTCDECQAIFGKVWDWCDGGWDGGISGEDYVEWAQELRDEDPDAAAFLKRAGIDTEGRES